MYDRFTPLYLTVYLVTSYKVVAAPFLVSDAWFFVFGWISLRAFYYFLDDEDYDGHYHKEDDEKEDEGSDNNKSSDSCCYVII